MKYVLAIGINIFLIALCMFLLHTCDIHAVKVLKMIIILVN